MNNMVFPAYHQYSNYQLNQCILKKGESQSIKFTIDHDDNDYLLLLSKTSLAPVSDANPIIEEER